MKNAIELLDEFDKITSDENVFPSERALYLLLSINKVVILRLLEEDLSGYWLHKALRQIDVTECGDMDMVIYHLLHQSTLFWKLLEENKNDSL